jgi:hypothetical protein
MLRLTGNIARASIGSSAGNLMKLVQQNRPWLIDAQKILILGMARGLIELLGEKFKLEV